MEKKAKHILFVLPTAQIGGTRTSLLNLIRNMDKTKYQIDVMFIRSRGEMINQFKSLCNVLPQDKILLAGRETGSVLLKQKKFGLVLKCLWFIVKSKLTKQSRYEIAYRQAAKNYDNKYDCVIAYQEKDASEFARYIVAPQKVTWVHTDFSRTIKGRGESQFSAVTNSFDKAVFVSDGCMADFKKLSHVDHNKMVRIYNTFDSEQIIEKSKEYIADIDENVPNFVSIGRVSEPKRFERAVSAASRLKSEGYKFRWYIIGDGELFSELESAVKTQGVEDVIILTGRKANPYPYLIKANAMVITSILESHPMVANESFILSVPVVSTNFPSAAEVITDGYSGILCENDADGVYSGVKKALDNPEMLKQMKENLQGFTYDNATIIKQVEDVIEGR